MAPSTSALADQLSRVEAKLDRLLRAQESFDELVDDGMHIARELTHATTPTLLDLERKGWFAKGAELWHVVDEVVEGYSVEDVRLLAENVVTILDTVRSITQPDVMHLASEAMDAVHHAEDLEPVGPLGLLRASRDEDVQRGISVVMEVVRRIGEGTARLQTPHAPAPRVRAPASPTPGHVRRPPAVAPPPAATAPPAAAPPASGGGLAYDAQGFLLDREAWTPELAGQLAAASGITLTDAHWQVLGWIREEYARTGASPNVRRVAQGADVPIRTLYELFPKGPGKTAARIAGVPKPAGCI